MRLAGQLLAVFAALSGLDVLCSAWADSPVMFVVSAFLTVAAGSLALVIAYVLDRRPRVPVHGPVLKWGYSEDAMHQQRSGD